MTCTGTQEPCKGLTVFSVLTPLWPVRTEWGTPLEAMSQKACQMQGSFDKWEFCLKQNGRETDTGLISDLHVYTVACMDPYT